MNNLFLSKRKRYVKAMLLAIDKAAYDCWSGNYKSKTNGLRVIKRFEKVNKIKFNPFDSWHVDTIYGWGWAESSFKCLNKVIKE